MPQPEILKVSVASNKKESALIHVIMISEHLYILPQLMEKWIQFNG